MRHHHLFVNRYGEFTSKKSRPFHWKALLLLAALLTFTSAPALASSAVAYNPQTGAWKVVWGYPSAGVAEAWALKGCQRLSRGRGSCIIIKSCEEGGYLQVMEVLGANNRRVGLVANCGYSSTGVLNQRIRNYCDAQVRAGHGRRCNTVKYWYDSANDGHVPQECKGAHPSRDPCYRWPYPSDWY